MATTSLTTSTVSLTVAWLCLTTVTMATAGAELRTLRYNMSEESEAGSFIGDFKRDYYSADRGRQAQGHDLGDLRFAFRSPSKYFRIDSVTGVIRTTRRIDREQLCPRQSASCDPYDQTLDVIVTPTQHFSLAKVRVTVIDVNDNAPAFPVDEMALDVWDNSPSGALFSVPYAEDPDGGAFDVRNYTLVGGQGRFELKVTDLLDGSHDVRIKLMTRLEGDRHRNYNLTVIATDGGSPARSGSLLVRVSVRGVAEVRPTFDKETFTARVEENSPTNRWVTKVQASTSGGSQPIVYSLVELPEVTDRRIPFRIDARTGSVYVSAPVDYERDRDFRLTVAATSGGRPALTAHAQLVIEVVDVNDNAPEITVNTLLRSGRGQVQENAPNGTFVAHVVIKDVDSGENSWTACLTNSAIFLLEELSASEYKLTTAVTFDREDEIQHRVKVVCHDFGTPSLTSSVQLSIDVTDVNDNDPVFTPRGSYSLVVSEGVALDSMLLRVSATDADDGQNAVLSYSLASLDTPPSRVVAIDPQTGEIRVKGVLDYETKSSYRFLLTAIDSGDPPRTGSASLTLELKDVNDELPRFIEDSYAFIVVADRAVGSPLGRVKATDSDASELHRNVSYYVETMESIFDVDPNTGQLRTREVLRQGQFFEFSVRASNIWSSIQLSSTTNISVFVNGTLPSFLFPNPSNSSVTLDPSVVKVGDVIAEVKVEHSNDVTLRYEIVYGSGDKERGFNIDERTGHIAVASDLDKNRVYQLVLRVTDDLDPQNEVTARLSVHVTETSYGLLRLQTWLGSRERLMTMVGVIVGLALLVILVSIGAFVSLRIRRRKTLYRGEYNCRYEASRALKARSGDAGLAMVDDVNQAGVLLTSGKPRTPTKKKEVTFSLDEEVDDEEEDELYKGNQNIYTRSSVKGCGDGLLSSPDDNESIGSDSGKGASEEGDSAAAAASRLPPRAHHHPLPPHTHGRIESEGREPSSVPASVSGSSLKPVRITVPPQMLPHSRIPPPPPPSSSLDRGQPVVMTTFKAASLSLSYSPKGLRSVESELSEHSPAGATSPLLSRSTHGAHFLEYATDV